MLMLQTDSIRDRVNAIEEISALPTTVARILAIVQDDSATALDLATELGREPALSMKVLRVVNSPYYGFARQIVSIQDAVVLLGFAEVERLALGISIINLFGRDREGVKSLQMLWRHSLACSLVGSLLESERGLGAALRGAHVAGLLHDMGKAVIVQYFPEVVVPVMHLVEEAHLPLHEAESDVLSGANHADIGAWIAERWDLPEPLVKSIALHHTPDQAAPEDLLVHATHIMDEICNEMGIGSGQNYCAPAPNPRSCEIIGFGPHLETMIHDHLTQNRRFVSTVAGGLAY
ncbi:MAG: HDOD domain-containing protein [Candidatus Hydrogenedentes bacterium]|nr:HDOD domain-containing protein [Candidatus Hydrogenedentota bacterium]